MCYAQVVDFVFFCSDTIMINSTKRHLRVNWTHVDRTLLVVIFAITVSFLNNVVC